MQETKPLSFQ
uniref:Uncharacterized protein n=1 Tax=Rhizophora mucronata TaxID=61149 RepID=A0A2P2MJH3_RHIMU